MLRDIPSGLCGDELLVRLSPLNADLVELIDLCVSDLGVAVLACPPLIADIPVYDLLH